MSTSGDTLSTSVSVQYTGGVSCVHQEDTMMSVR